METGLYPVKFTTGNQVRKRRQLDVLQNQLLYASRRKFFQAFSLTTNPPGWLLTGELL